MNVHQPLKLKKIEHKLMAASRLLKSIDAEDWAVDVEQTAYSIRMEYEKEKDQEKEENNETIM